MPYQKGDGKSVVIALGGNALGNTPQEQLDLVKNTAKHIVDMVGEGTNVVVSHGNGPQVGMINNAFAYASQHDGKTPEMPFPEAGAMSQGYIGYQLSQAILNDMKERGIMRSTACVVTQTVVDPEDPAFQNPTKPVGAFLTEEEAKAKAEETGWTFKEDAGRGWRQVVASPKPVRIVEFDAVKDLMDKAVVTELDPSKKKDEEKKPAKKAAAKKTAKKDDAEGDEPAKKPAKKAAPKKAAKKDEAEKKPAAKKAAEKPASEDAE